MKVCTKCKEEKELINFCKNNAKKDRLNNCCKQCINNYISLNKEAIKIYNKKRNEKNKDKIKINNSNWNKNNKEKVKEYKKVNRDKIKENSKKWRINRPEYANEWKKNNPEYQKEYHINNKEKLKEYSKEYNSKPENKEKNNKRDRERRKNDPQFKLRKNLRTYLLLKLKTQNINKSESALVLVGCTIKELKQYLENQFLPEFTWENHGIIWEIDHIEPCSNFDLTKLNEQQECFHYTNLKPIFKTNEIAESFGYKGYIGNRNKGNRFE